MGVMVMWDKERIAQVLTNVLENSLRYTHAPGQILVRVDMSDSLHVRICIEDSPPSVATSALTQILLSEMN